MGRVEVILLDTHALVWFASAPQKLSVRARRAIDGATSCGVAAISCFEIAMLAERGRLRLDRDIRAWLQQVLGKPGFELLPLEPEVSIKAAELEWEHRDPADRIIVATAMTHRLEIVSKDEWIRSYKGVRSIW